MMRSITPFLSTFIAILLMLFFVEPQYAKVVEIQNEIHQYKVAVDRYTDFSNALDAQLQKKKSRSLIDTERLDVFVPNAIDDTHSLIDLSSMAKKRNMLFGNVTSAGGGSKLTQGQNEESVQSDELVTNDISFEVIGTYKQFKDFLHDLESSLTLFEISSVSLNASQGNFQQFGVTVRTYALSN